jgi:hypothetical protein
MSCPREIVDALESVLGIYFSAIRNRERAAFILADELAEMACKLRALEHNYRFDMRCGFHDAWNAPGVQIPAHSLGDTIQHNRLVRNNMQHGNVAAAVDDQFCADAILDAIQVIDHCWPGTSCGQSMRWKACALRVVRLHSSLGDPKLKRSFEDKMRDGEWRAEKRQARTNELIILPGRRQYWSLLMIESQDQVEAILNSLGIP